MNASLKIMKLMEKKKELKEAEEASWNGFTTVLGMGFTFSGGCVLCMLTISQTPHWTIYLAIGGAIITVLLSFLLYNVYREAKKKKKTVRG